MRIAAVEGFRLRPRLIKEGYGAAGSVWPGELPCFLVRVSAEDGTTGVGEATSQVWYLGETAEQIASVLALYDGALRGLQATDLARAHAAMQAVYGGGAPAGNSARAGVDMALHDLAGKALGVPVHALLGGALRGELGLLTNLYHDTPEAMAEACRDFAGRGFAGLKVKVGESLLVHGWSHAGLEGELAKLEAALAAVPAEVMVDADANQAWRSPQATVAALRRFAGYGNLAIEQPLPLDDLSGAAFVRAHAGVPVVLDEPVRSPGAVMQMIRLGAADRVVVKLNRVGGLHPARRIVAVCEAAGVGVSVDTNPFTLVGDTASAHLAATVPTPYPVDCEGHVSFLDLEAPVLSGGVAVAGGRARLPEAPGLGVEVDWPAVAPG